MKTYLKASITVGLLITLMLVSPRIKHAAASANLYVKLNGSDTNNCSSPSTACGTINGALAKASNGDTILVTADTYYGYGPDLVFISKSVILSGGWDQNFTNRVGQTVLDGSSKRVVLEITQASSVSVEYFVIQNGKSSTAAGGISNYGLLSLVNSIVQHNTGASLGGGVTNYGTLTVKWSMISENYGTGIYNWDNAQPLTVENSTISNNTHGSGVHVYNQNATFVNSTISGNNNNGAYDGGGIYYNGTQDHVLLLLNDTIANNTAASSGGGIHFVNTGNAQVRIGNSIIYGNHATLGPECVGPITSQGYNMIGSIAGCTFNSSTGDQLDINPMLAPLLYNGGPTPTHRLIAGSRAIDGGNPAGCLDQHGQPLGIDQRGFTRPLDGNGDGTPVCDVGSYEYDPTLIFYQQYLPVIKR